MKKLTHKPDAQVYLGSVTITRDYHTFMELHPVMDITDKLMTDWNKHLSDNEANGAAITRFHLVTLNRDDLSKAIFQLLKSFDKFRKPDGTSTITE